MLILSVTITFLMLGVLWLAAVLHEHGLKPMRRMAELMKRPAAEIALVALIAIGMIHHGATKGTNGVNGAGGEMGGTNSVQNMGGVLTGLMGLPGFGDDGGQGLLALPTTNYQLPTTNLDWLAFGGYEDWFYLDGGGWCFRFGSNLVERLTVVSCGEISPAPYDESNRISLLGLPLAILPAANWHLLGNGEQGTGNGEQGTGNCQLPTTNYQLKSLFCHEETPSNTLLLTWRNALVNRDTDLPVTVQAELFPDGAVAFRYDFSGIGDINALSNAEAQIWRDGVLASSYQLPTIDYQLSTTNYQLNSFFDALPITGTNLIGEVYARIAGGNSNAYYCADVVVEKGPAKIRVEPLGVETNQGLLGTYEIVAMPGETNRLPLLIGPKYAVTAESAFGSFELVPPPFVPLADDTGTVERLSFGDALTLTNITDRLVEVGWPVEFALEEIDATSEATTYALRITPDWLDGVVTWHGIVDTNAPPMRGAPPVRSGGSSCSCGCLVRDGLDLIHSQTCSCQHCSAEGECSYEGHSENISIDVKDSSIGGEPPGPGGDGGNDPPDPDEPSVSVSFDKNVVILEDMYQITTNVFGDGRSTTTKLTLTANGGEYGGAISLPQLGELVERSGNSPMPTSVAAHESVQWEGYYEATNASPYQGGTKVKARLTEYQTGVPYESNEASLTAVKITVAPIVDPPVAHMVRRHKLGVREVVSCTQTPVAPQVTWTYNVGYHHMEGNSYYYHCPLGAVSDPLRVAIGNVSYTPNLTVIEPHEVIATDAHIHDFGVHPNQAGYVGMDVDLNVGPMDVSFAQLAIEEVPCNRGDHLGYFANTYFSNLWCHSVNNGAGRWQNVSDDNDFAMDGAACLNALPRMILPGYPGESMFGWYYGYLSWDVPYGWGAKVQQGNVSLYDTFAEDVKHDVTIDAEGTVSIFKLGCWAYRSTNDFTMVYGGVNNGYH